MILPKKKIIRINSLQKNGGMIFSKRLIFLYQELGSWFIHSP